MINDNQEIPPELHAVDSESNEIRNSKLDQSITPDQGETHAGVKNDHEYKDAIQNDGEPPVSASECSLGDILKWNLTLPEYQRDYVWNTDNVLCLLEDIFDSMVDSTPHRVYRLGTVIFHRNGNRYDIIDGQQRLVTLALLLQELDKDLLRTELGWEGERGLLQQKYASSQSIVYVAYNRYIIQNFLNNRLHGKDGSEIAKEILEKLQMTVLTVQNNSLDLAFVFFSNQNLRGVELTDYDLLKAHHLRFIPQSQELQAQYAAMQWDSMVNEGRKDKEEQGQADYEIVLDTFIYHLRRWMRRVAVERRGTRHRIKREYEAAPIIAEIESTPPDDERPPSDDEKFYFNQTIRGGSHFFEYVNFHRTKFSQFKQTPSYIALKKIPITGANSFLIYHNVIAALLFAYYLKFGQIYLAEALFVIMRNILQHRYENKRAREMSIINHALQTNLVDMIDRATSPTFFLAEARNRTKTFQWKRSKDMAPIQKKMFEYAKNIAEELENKNEFRVESLKNSMKEYYERMSSEKNE